MDYAAPDRKKEKYSFVKQRKTEPPLHHEHHHRCQNPEQGPTWEDPPTLLCDSAFAR